MSARIDQAFARRREQGSPALIPYVTCGDPDLASTVPVMQALVQAGADVIELGVPFSDPMADGPVIQRASERAIAGGTGLRDVLSMVAQFRRTDSVTPVVLMGYANPVERMGVEVFAEAAAAAGVDGVLVVDYPPEEAGDFAALLKRHGIAPIFLLAPTSSDERIAQVASLAAGYVYYVSLNGVTGAAHLQTAEVGERVKHLQASMPVPIGVGFGIRDAASARAIGEHADAVVIGSRLIQEIEAAVKGHAPAEWPTLAASAAGRWLRTIRDALDLELQQ